MPLVRSHRCLSAAGTLLLAGLPIDAQGGNWERVFAEDGLEGYARTIEGSDILEFRSIGIVPAPIEVVSEILRDVEGLERGSEHCDEAWFVTKRSRDTYTFYVHYAYPAPISDRDVVVSVSIRYDLEHGRAVADLVAVPEAIVPLREGTVRIVDLRAQFVIEYLTREKTGVVYTSRLDPGGYIPDWLVNYTGKKALKSAGVDMRAAIRDPKYTEAAKGSPDYALVEGLLADRETIRRVQRNRLAQFIRDANFIAAIVDDDSLLVELTRGEGAVGEVLLYGWGSPESKARAVAVLLEMVLRARRVDHATIARLTQDRGLLAGILSGASNPTLTSLLRPAAPAAAAGAAP